MNLKITPEKICCALLSTIVILLIANTAAILLVTVQENESILAQFLWRFFLFDNESNFPTYYSSFTLFFSSIILSLIALKIKQDENNKDWLYWSGLSLIFLYLAFDEFMCIHEYFMWFVKLDGVFYFSWVVIAIPFLLIFTLVYLRFIQRLPTKIMLLFILSGFIYVAGAIGMEMIGGWFVSETKNAAYLYYILTSIEETMEMLGIALFIYSLLVFIKTDIKEINISVVGKS